MDWQLLLTLLFVLGAGGYLLYRSWRTWRASRAGCGGGCGCATSTPEQTEKRIPAEQLTLRRPERKA